jgi:hypothetical protein
VSDGRRLISTFGGLSEMELGGWPDGAGEDFDTAFTFESAFVPARSVVLGGSEQGISDVGCLLVGPLVAYGLPVSLGRKPEGLAKDRMR